MSTLEIVLCIVIVLSFAVAGLITALKFTEMSPSRSRRVASAILGCVIGVSVGCLISFPGIAIGDAIVQVAEKKLLDARCQECLLPLTFSDHYCPNCGAAREKCLECKNQIKPSDKFCPDCGTAVVRKE